MSKNNENKSTGSASNGANSQPNPDDKALTGTPSASDATPPAPTENDKQNPGVGNIEEDKAKEGEQPDPGPVTPPTAEGAEPGVSDEGITKGKDVVVLSEPQRN